MNPCTCKDWTTTGETFHETIGMIAIYFCPWCGAHLGEGEVIVQFEVDGIKKTKALSGSTIVIPSIIEEPLDEN